MPAPSTGSWRFGPIDRHLKASPEHNFAPLFDVIEPWCRVEEGRGDIFSLLIRCWPALCQGVCGKLRCRFLLWSVFLTHSLTGCERDDDHRILGMDPRRFDAEVMRHRKRTAGQAFPWASELGPCFSCAGVPAGPPPCRSVPGRSGRV